AQFQAGETNVSLATLEHAARLPRGLSPADIDLFNPMIRDFAEQHVSSWPPPSQSASTFLAGLPDPGPTLTEREVEILRHLTRGQTRARIAQALGISPKIDKTKLR